MRLLKRFGHIFIRSNHWQNIKKITILNSLQWHEALTCWVEMYAPGSKRSHLITQRKNLCCYFAVSWNNCTVESLCIATCGPNSVQTHSCDLHHWFQITFLYCTTHQLSLQLTLSLDPWAPPPGAGVGIPHSTANTSLPLLGVLRVN